MQILTILATLREELAHAEQDVTQAWHLYYREVSSKALAEAEETMKRMAALHRQFASRLEQIAGKRHSHWESLKPGTAGTPRVKLHLPQDARRSA